MSLTTLAVKLMYALQVPAMCYTIYSVAAVVILKLGAWQKKIKPLFKKLLKLNCLQRRKKFKPIDFVLLTVLIITYSIFAFWRLGSNDMAQTSWQPKQGESVTFSVKKSASSLCYVLGIVPDKTGAYPKAGSNIVTQVSADGLSWANLETSQEIKNAVFTWHELTLPEKTYFVRLTAQNDSVVLNEIGLRNGDKELTPVNIVTGSGAALIDEQHIVPQYQTYENSMYFDEIYHARTAYEHLKGLEPYENTHPPLGKLIIAVGIKLFGMNPFGWRFMGALCGVLMLPVLYHLLMQLIGNTFVCSVATFLFSFDFMHFTQTRIATIDTFAVLFILLMYDAMVVFLHKDLQNTPMKKLLLPLLVSGVCMGLGIAAKWTVAYGAIGLAVLFFCKLAVTYKKQGSKLINAIILHRCAMLCLWCVLFFAVLPFAIYFAAFLPITLLPHNKSNAWTSFWSYQSNMLKYHTQLTAQHPYSSQWYEWPLSIRPMWYYVSNPANKSGDYATIAAFGSPLLWWPCAAAIIYAAWRAFYYKCRASAIVVIGFLSVYLPWIFVPRSMFIYHYFPAIPFLIAAMGLAVQNLMQKPLLKRKIISSKNTAITLGAATVVCYAAINAAMFVLFWPVLSGMPVALQTIERLRWLPKWYF